jgi:hypothetical protein
MVQKHVTYKILTFFIFIREAAITLRVMQSFIMPELLSAIGVQFLPGHALCSFPLPARQVFPF